MEVARGVSRLLLRAGSRMRTDVPVGLQPCHRRALVKAHVTIMGKTGASDATTDSLGQATFAGVHVSDVTTVFVDNVAVRNVTRSPTE